MKARCLLCIAKIGIGKLPPCFKSNWWETGSMSCLYNTCSLCGHTDTSSYYQPMVNNPVNWYTDSQEWICKKCITAKESGAK